MPSEAFRDMWATLQAGKPWSALVKNRRKNGDHYWVQANATPIMENGKAVGYMSVRTKPSREQVRQAEALYEKMRAEAAQGRLLHGLEAGELRHNSFSGWAKRAASFSVNKTLWITYPLLGAFSVIVGEWAGQSLREGLHNTRRRVS